MPSQLESSITLTFRCPIELDGLLPPPVPAALGVPDWFKAMPSQAFNPVHSRVGDTLKRCPPFVDAMTSGFLIPLICDLRVENGEFTWDNDLPPGGEVHNLWTIEAPEGYSVLFTHPANRFDLPFTTLTGLVDCDLYHDNWIHFPAHWHDTNFSGVLPKGTPVAQCMPVKRESWVARTATFTKEEAQRAHDLTTAIYRETGIYRRQFRA
jgi:hypothetical protein